MKGLFISFQNELELQAPLSRPALMQNSDNKNLIYRHKLWVKGDLKESLTWSCLAYLNRNHFSKGAISKAVFLETSIRWKIKQSFTLQLEGYNLLNLRSFSLTEQQLGLFQNRLSIPLVPRQIIAGLKLAF
jgi:hypothetical protein